MLACSFFAFVLRVVYVFAAIATALIIRVGGGQVFSHLQALSVVGGWWPFWSTSNAYFFRCVIRDEYTILQSAMASSERIFRVLDEPITLEVLKKRQRFKRCAARLSSVAFRSPIIPANGCQGHLVQDHAG